MKVLGYNEISYAFPPTKLNIGYKNIKSSRYISSSSSSVRFHICNICGSSVWGWGWMYEFVHMCMCYSPWCMYRHLQSLQLVIWLDREGCDGGYSSGKVLFFRLWVWALIVLNLLLYNTCSNRDWLGCVWSLRILLTFLNTLSQFAYLHTYICYFECIRAFTLRRTCSELRVQGWYTQLGYLTE